MLLEILKHPNPKLKEKSLEISPEMISNAEFKEFMKNLGETMLKNDGMGLAAPQVDRLVRIIMVKVGDMTRIYINPRITKKSWRKDIVEEGCLSIPGIYEKVRRPIAISLEFLDLNAKKHKIKASGLSARVIQHEVDHLDGILFIDKTL